MVNQIIGYFVSGVIALVVGGHLYEYAITHAAEVTNNINNYSSYIG